MERGDDSPADSPRYAPGMDERSTRIAERLATPMLIAAALVLPSVALRSPISAAP